MSDDTSEEYMEEHMDEIIKKVEEFLTKTENMPIIERYWHHKKEWKIMRYKRFIERKYIEREYIEREINTKSLGEPL